MENLRKFITALNGLEFIHVLGMGYALGALVGRGGNEKLFIGGFVVLTVMEYLIRTLSKKSILTI